MYNVPQSRGLRVAVDDADDDDDTHAGNGRDGQRQPAVLEAPSHDMAQKYRPWVFVVGRSRARHVTTRANRRPLALLTLLTRLRS